MTTRFVSPTGPRPARTMLIGEGPGVAEERRGFVFCGPSGQTLDANLWRVSLPRDRVRVRNLVNYRVPDDGDPTEADIERDEEDLWNDIRATEPFVIGTLGRASTRYFLGDVDMDTVHGIPHKMTAWPTRHGKDFIVVPCYHPAAGLHNPDVAAAAFDDLRQVALVAKGKLLALDRTDQYPEPDYQELRYPLKKVGSVIAIDTEGTFDAPWSLQFTDKPGAGYLIRAGNATMINWFRKVLEQTKLIVIHNTMYDLPMLRAMGLEVPMDRTVDTMVMAYLLRLEPQGLKNLASRWCSMEMQSYDDLTGPWDRKQVIKYLRPMVNITWPKPDMVIERDPSTGGKKIRQPQPLHIRLRALLSADPDKTSVRKGWYSIDASTRSVAEARFGKMPRFSLDNVPADLALRYACRDPDATFRIYPHLAAKITAFGLDDLLKMKMGLIPITERMQDMGMPADKAKFAALDKVLVKQLKGLQLKLNEANGGKYINANSGDQVAPFLFRKLRLPPSKMTKSRKRFSTNDKVLELLRHKHPAVELIIDYRETAKTKDSFCDTLPDHMDRNGRVHPTLRITRVASGRLSASNPNLQAIPVRSDIGRKVRGCFVAPEGRLLGSCDLDQIEMRIMADESRDPKLLKLFRDGRDIHAQTASDMFGIPLEKVDPILHRYPAKRTGFGVITGISGAGLVDQMFLAGIYKYSEADCNEFIKGWFKIYTGVAGYMNDCRLEGRRLGYVKDRWGMPRYLPGMWSPIASIRAEAERQTHSHKIQGGAQGLIQRAEARVHKRLAKMRAKGYYAECLLQIHDELVTEHDENLDSLVEAVVVGEMTAESKMFAVPIKSKFASGRAWDELKG